MLGNLHDFDPVADAVAPDAMMEIDRWILVRAETLVANCRAWYGEFAFHKVYRAVYDFATIDLSSIYFDVLKDRLYTSAPRSPARRSAQTAVYRLTHALVRLLAPLLSFTTEEVWGYFRRPAGAPDSVHLALLPEPSELTEGFTAEHRTRLENWDRLLPIRDRVLKSLDTARDEKLIRAPLEARVRLKADPDLYPLLREYAPDLPALFIVSQVALENGSEGLTVDVERADGVKCERCWKYTLDVGQHPRFPTICAACGTAVDEILSDPHA
jgi:isoleucyl-tRNA synthetase